MKIYQYSLFSAFRFGSYSCQCRLLFFGSIIFVMLFSKAPAKADEAMDKNLITAVMKRDASTVRALIASGADVNAEVDADVFAETTDSSEIDPIFEDVPITPLRTSVYCGCVDIAKILLTAGAKVRAHKGIALYEAISFSDFDMAEILLEAFGPPQSTDLPLVPILLIRANPKVVSTMRAMAEHLIVGTPLPPGFNSTPSISSINELIRPPLTTSSVDPAIKFLDAARKKGFPIDIDPRRGNSRTIAAAVGDVFFFQALKERGASAPPGLTAAQEDQSLLVNAAAAGNDVGIQLLLTAKVDPNIASPDGRFALAAAAENNQPDDIQLRLLASGANPNLMGPEQHGALTSAILGGNMNMVNKLLASHADPNLPDSFGEWPFRAACRHGDIAMVDALINAGADVNLRNNRGHTALHGIALADKASVGETAHDVTESTYLIIKDLQAHKFNFSVKDSAGVGIIESNLGSPSINLRLIQTLISIGAPVGSGELKKAVQLKSAGSLELFIHSAPAVAFSSDLIESALNYYHYDEGVAVALLRAKSPLPASTYVRVNLLVVAARLPSETVLGLLIKQGLSPIEDSDNDALIAALAAGRPAQVRLLAENGADLKKKHFGSPLLNRLIDDDLRRHDKSVSTIGKQQQEAIAALIDGGYDLNMTNTDGQTAIAEASADSVTLAAINAAVGLAGTSSDPLHMAIQKNDLAEVRRLLAAPNLSLNLLDSLGRTPLSYALQLNRYPIVRALLLAGAEITFSPRLPYLRPDLDFASNPAVADAFGIRLFQQRLLNLPPAVDNANLLAIIQEYSANNHPILPDLVWSFSVTCKPPQCEGSTSLSGNADNSILTVRSDRTEDGTKVTYGLVQYSIGSRTITANGKFALGRGVATLAINAEVTFNITGELHIPGCNWDITRPVCAPGIRIENPNTPTTLKMKTNEGWEPLPTASFTAIQAGNVYVIQPGNAIVLDRSLGEIVLKVDPVTAKVFALQVLVSPLPGPPALPLPEDQKIENRMAAYIQMARLQALKKKPETTSDIVANKTYDAALMALTAEAVIVTADYRRAVLTELREKAADVAGINQQVLDLRALVIASSRLTPNEISGALDQITRLLADPAVKERETLLDVQAALKDALSAAQANHSAVVTMKDDTYNEVDRKLEAYQARVLEYAQYVPVNRMFGALDQETISAIKTRLSPHDVLINNNVMGGQGAILRSAFGLPDPGK